MELPENPPLDVQGIKAWLNEAYAARLGKKESKDPPLHPHHHHSDTAGDETKAKEKEKEAVEAMQGLVMALRTQRVEIGNEIEVLTTQLSESVEPTVEDAYRIIEEAKGLKAMLAGLVPGLASSSGGGNGSGSGDREGLGGEEAEEEEEEAADPLEEIAPFHAAKSKMVHMLTTIQEVENWNMKLQTIEAVFETHDVEKIGQEVAGLHRSAMSFKGLKDFKERTDQLESLKDRMEVVAKARLLAAMDTQDIEAIRKMVGLFASIDRQGSVKDYFLRSREERILGIISRFTSPDDDDAADGTGGKESVAEQVIEWLPLFFNETLAVLKEDVRWANEAFGESGPRIAIAYLAMVCRLVPSEAYKHVEEFLSGLKAKSSEKAPERVVEVFDICSQFTKALLALTPAKKPIPTPGEERERKQAEQKQLESEKKKQEPAGEGRGEDEHGREKKGDEDVEALSPDAAVRVLMGPLVKCEPWHHELEALFAPSTLELRRALMRCEEEDYTAVTKGVGDWLTASRSWLSSVVSRSVSLNGGGRAVELTRTVDERLAQELGNLSAALGRLERDEAGGENSKKKRRKPKAGKDVKSGDDNDEEEEEEDEEDSDLLTTDWRMLSFGFRVFEKATEIRPSIALAEAEIQSQLARALKILLDGKEDGRGFEDKVHRLMVADDTTRIAALRGFLSKALESDKKEEGACAALPRTLKQADAVVETAEKLTFAAMMRPITVQLSGLHTWGVWAEGETKSLLKLPEFSVQPSDYATRIGEHMLSLIQQLEPHLGGAGAQSEEQDEEADEDRLEPMYWLGMVAREVLDILMKEVLRIGDKFSEKGRRQMKADIGYLANVINALDVDIGNRVPKLLETLTEKSSTKVETDQATGAFAVENDDDGEEEKD